MSLSVVKADKRGEHLYITLQGANVTEVSSPMARRFAYDRRGDYGFDNAGIEADGGPYPIDITKKDEDGRKGKPVAHTDMEDLSKRASDLAYRHTYRLTRGI